MGVYFKPAQGIRINVKDILSEDSAEVVAAVAAALVEGRPVGVGAEATPLQELLVCVLV